MRDSRSNDDVNEPAAASAPQDDDLGWVEEAEGLNDSPEEQDERAEH